jgi:hypothetical protein
MLAIVPGRAREPGHGVELALGFFQGPSRPLRKKGVLCGQAISGML